MIKRITKIFLMSILFLSLFMGAFCFALNKTYEKEQVSALSVTLPEYYGRYALSQLPDSTDYLYAYDCLVNGVENTQTTISVHDSTHSISVDELKMVYDAYRRDHTEQFWLGNEYSISNVGGVAYSLNPSYFWTGSALIEAKEQFNLAVQEMLSTIDDEMDDYEREITLHDALAKKVTYIESANAHNAYGAIVEGKAVCEGYAEALQHLLRSVGVQSFLIIGSSVNPSTGLSEGHAWNAVKIDDEFYHVDLTWNDQGERLFRAYFNVTDSVITADHVIAETVYALPVCNSTDANYFTLNGRVLNEGSYSASEVGALLKENGFVASVYINGDVSAFLAWYTDNILSIAQHADVSGKFSYGYAVLGNEVMLNLNNCKHDSLTFVEPKSADCENDGNVAYYKCTCGNLYLDEGATQKVTDANTLVVKAEGHNYVKQVVDGEHLKELAPDCQHYNVYWLTCERCDKNAKNDSKATDKYFLSDIVGAHDVLDSWSAKDGKHFHKCSISGCEFVTDEEICDGGIATCQSKAKCATCGNDYGDYGDHDYDLTAWGYRGVDGHARKCKTSGCGHHDDVKPHTPGEEATDTTPQICTDCEYILVPALSHTTHTPKAEWESDDDHHWHECVECSGQQLEKGEHDFENECDADCSVCGFTRDTSHSYDGDCDESCNKCGAIRQPLHKYGDEWHKDGEKHWKECSCGAKTGEKTHSDANSDNKCDICGAVNNSAWKLDIDMNLVIEIGKYALMGVGAIIVLVIVIKILKKIFRR